MYTYSVCVHVYMHTHVHTYINTYMHTYINTFSHAYIAHKELILALPHHTHAHTHTHTHTHTRTHAHISRGGALLYQETRVIWAVVCCCVLAARVDRSVALWVRMRTALALFRCWAFWCQIRLPVFLCWTRAQVWVCVYPMTHMYPPPHMTQVWVCVDPRLTLGSCGPARHQVCVYVCVYVCVKCVYTHTKT